MSDLNEISSWHTQLKVYVLVTAASLFDKSLTKFLLADLAITSGLAINNI